VAVELLLRTPNPLGDESILGYVLRVSETNGYDTPWHVFRHAGYEQGEMITAGMTVQRLAAILGKNPDQLEKHAYLGTDKDGKPEYRLNGRPIGRRLTFSPLRLNRPAICIACVKEQGFANVCWDASVYVACPLHRSMLLQRCPACNCGLTWLRPGLLTCRCGASLADATTEQASAATIELMRVLRSKILDDPPAPVSETDCGLPLAQLSAMSLNSMLRVIAILEKLNGDVVHANGSVAAAVEVFTEWPKGFHAYLRRMASEGVASNVHSIGLRKRFSRLYQSLFKAQIAISGIEFMREAFVAFGLREWGLATVDAKLLRGEPQESRFVSACKFAEAAGVMPITVQKWVQDGTLPGAVIELTTGNRYVLDVEEAKESRRRNNDRIGIRDAARKAGIPVSVLRELKRSKQYSPSPTINRRPGFWAIDLDALSARILATAVKFPVGCPPCTEESLGLISLGSILQDKKFGGDRAKGILVSELLDGKIISVGRLDDTIATIHLRLGDVDDFRLRFGIRVDKGTVTVSVAAVMLGCGTQAVDGLIKAGHLLRQDGSRTGIRRDSVASFQKQWTSAHARGKDIGTSSVWVAGRAVALGVPTLRVPVRDGREATFVAVAGIQQVMDDGAKRNARRMKQARRLSSAEVRDEVVRALRTYLAELHEHGEPLPMRGGKPNRSEIARICRFSRDVFYTNPELLSLLDGENRRTSSDALESHRRSMDRYLDSLSVAGLEIPKRAGKPNRAAIATACGFARNVFYNHPEMGARVTALALEPVPGRTVV
jgi:hypothetical protein